MFLSLLALFGFSALDIFKGKINSLNYMIKNTLDTVQHENLVLNGDDHKLLRLLGQESTINSLHQENRFDTSIPEFKNLDLSMTNLEDSPNKLSLGIFPKN